MGSIISLSRKSKSSKRLHSKDNRSFSSKIASTSSTLPSGSNESISDFSDVSTAHSFYSTCLIDDFTGQEQINLSLKFESSNSASTVSLLSDSIVSTALLPTKCVFDASTCQRQNFAFPAPIIEYISMNPSSAKVYQKLIQTCKYFFARNPILVFPSLLHMNCENVWHDESSVIRCSCSWPDHRDGWEISYLKEKQELFGPCDLLLKDVPKNIKIWPTERMILNDGAGQIPSAITVSSIIPRFYRCDISMLFIFGPELFLDELKLLATNVERFECNWPSVKDENGFDLSLKDIIAVFPKLKQLICHIQRATLIPPEALPVAMNIPELQEFFEHYFDCNPDAFDIDSFCKFMIGNKNIEYGLAFHPDIPQTLKDRIDACEERLANEVYENDQKRPEIIVKKWKQNENEVEAN